MLNILRKLFGIAPAPDYAKLVSENAILLDVRTASEYAGGNIPGSINIPVDQLAQQLAKLKDKNVPVITYCASGMRSAMAKKILRSNGYAAVYNGGSMSGLSGKLKAVK